MARKRTYVLQVELTDDQKDHLESALVDKAFFRPFHLLWEALNDAVPYVPPDLDLLRENDEYE